MDLNEYIEPVALDKPGNHPGFSDSMLGRNIRIHTPNFPIDEISNYQIALLGVPEDRNSENTGSARAPDLIRSKFYELYRINDRIRIVDLGNLKTSSQVNDSYFGIRDVMMELLNNQVAVIVMGGSQDITHGIYMAYEETRESINVVTVDSRFDVAERGINASSWMAHMLRGKKLLGCTLLGHQQYLIDKKDLEELEDRACNILRLGHLRSSMMTAEPFLRDANLVSLDIAAVKQADAPGTRFPSPNGLGAEEICQLARYAGMGDQASCFGIFEVNPEFDIHGQTAHLAAQAAWYFVEGFSQRKREVPSPVSADFKVFLVNHHDMEHALTFYKSLVTGRWWMEIPVMRTGKPVMAACTDDEYQQACNHDIPEMWWKAFQKMN